MRDPRGCWPPRLTCGLTGGFGRTPQLKEGGHHNFGNRNFAVSACCSWVGGLMETLRLSGQLGGGGRRVDPRCCLRSRSTGFQCGEVHLFLMSANSSSERQMDFHFIITSGIFPSCLA